MDPQRARFSEPSVAAAAMTVVLTIWSLDRTQGVQHWVGDSIWSVPLYDDFYSNWSSSHDFQIGDTLYFDFDTGLHNVVLVSKAEYESCVVLNSFMTVRVGPATILLFERGIIYFVCSIGNNCALGQKLAVTVDKHQQYNPPPFPSAPTPSPSLAPEQATTPESGPLQPSPVSLPSPVESDGGGGRNSSVASDALANGPSAAPCLVIFIGVFVVVRM